ncbi:c(7)-type cytochrome triheme domain-containing protein [Pyxidicoccus xibeiensis]|uniref:c(7)-type cytochrome triheme domain-containing protein n=1 Tax=Pyxidicoccus xibeiensis TaxID=2906759 RepID=UPI0020A71D15|nr:c(7)-type cytochrome triheme domain-containing protein [Pyxidicoccus xibeiensis]MCP3145331.1 hypothetical protein [Pyxidicoccus xibeiensis]
MSSDSPAPRPPALSARRSFRGWLALLGGALFATPILAFTLPQDVRIPPVKARPQPVPALFSHWSHNTQHCYSCHPGVFPQAPLGFTHQDMREGRFCGSCHDGKSAKAVSAMRCEGCHVAR